MTWLAVVLAPFVGSFLGVLIRRLPDGRPVVWGRSACEACGAVLGPAELLPVVSFLVQRGRCRRCGTRIAPAHLAVELAAAAVALAVVLVADPGWVWSGCLLGWGLLAAAWIDAETFWLPDVIVLPLIASGLLATWLLDRVSIVDHAAAAILAWAALRGLAWSYARLRGRDGLGEGDAKLLAVGGAWLGLQALPWVLLAAAAAGLTWAGMMRLRGQAVNTATMLPFGPPLAIAISVWWMIEYAG